MEDRRRYKRLRLDLLDINGKMSLAEKVEIDNISIGGVSLKADRRLNFGKEIMLKLGDKASSIDVRGVVVRSQLSGIEDRANGQQSMVYKVGMMFKDGQSNTISEFLKSATQNREQEEPVAVERRLSIRFSITTPQEKLLSFPAQFKVKTMSLTGMLIESEQALSIESAIPMTLSLNTDRDMHLVGRVVSCQMSDNKRQTAHEIGVEFVNLTDKDRAFIQTLIDYFSAITTDSETEAGK